MKTIGSLIVLAALLVGIVPQFTDCESHGKAIELGDGRTLPMKCHWTARGELALAIPLLASGLFVVFGAHRETRRCAAMIGLALGAMIVALPTSLIGVCGRADMICAAVMKPMLIVTGSLVSGLGALGFALSSRRGRGDCREKAQKSTIREEVGDV